MFHIKNFYPLIRAILRFKLRDVSSQVGENKLHSDTICFFA